jgi:hypothetical protein
VILLGAVAPAASQVTHEPAPPPAQHQHPAAPVGMADMFPAREASGTAWLPDFTPMYGLHRQAGGWWLMLHWNVFAQYLFESGDDHRSGSQGGSINWVMAMARRPAGSGRLGFRLMLSADPWTLGGCGYPNLLATGEMCDGDTIHDRQHPHDLFMELAADYDRPITPTLRWQLYAGLAGEPALGPAAFPHRLSSMSNPIAPITHHWLDSTHISFGVITTGIHAQHWKAEVSVFNGREPDENRGDFDFAAPDSVAGRFTWLPTKRLALQFSMAHLEEAEEEFAPDPRTDVDRATASVTYHRPAGANGSWASVLAWGMNSHVEVVPGDRLDLTTHALLLESTYSRSRHSIFGRFEVVGKPAHDLHAHEFITRVFTVGKLQAGYELTLPAWRGLVPGIGGTVSASLVPQELAVRYEGRVAPGFGVFVSLRPSRHFM